MVLGKRIRGEADRLVGEVDRVDLAAGVVPDAGQNLVTVGASVFREKAVSCSRALGVGRRDFPRCHRLQIIEQRAVFGDVSPIRVRIPGAFPLEVEPLPLRVVEASVAVDAAQLGGKLDQLVFGSNRIRPGRAAVHQFLVKGPDGDSRTVEKIELRGTAVGRHEEAELVELLGLVFQADLHAAVCDRRGRALPAGQASGAVGQLVGAGVEAVHIRIAQAHIPPRIVGSSHRASPSDPWRKGCGLLGTGHGVGDVAERFEDRRKAGGGRMARPALVFLGDGLGPTKHVVLLCKDARRVVENAPAGRVDIDLGCLVIRPKRDAPQRLDGPRFGLEVAPAEKNDLGSTAGSLHGGHVNPTDRHRQHVGGTRHGRGGGDAGGVKREALDQGRCARVHDRIHRSPLKLNRAIQVHIFIGPIIPIRGHFLAGRRAISGIIAAARDHLIRRIKLKCLLLPGGGKCPDQPGLRNPGQIRV